MLGLAGIAQTAIADIPHGGSAPPATVFEDSWHQPLSEPQRAKRGLAARHQQTFAFVQASPFTETVSEDRWHQPWSEPIRLNQRIRIRPGAQQFYAFQPTPIIDIGWHPPYTEPVRAKKRLTTGAQQAFAFVGFAPFPETVTEDRWHQPWSEPIRLNQRVRIRPGAQQFYAFHPWPKIDIAWHPPYTEPVRFKRRLTTGAQQTLAYVGADPFPEAVTEDRWHQPWSEPKRFKRGLRAADQRFLVISPLIGNPFSFGTVIQ